MSPYDDNPNNKDPNPYPYPDNNHDQDHNIHNDPRVATITTKTTMAAMVAGMAVGTARGGAHNIVLIPVIQAVQYKYKVNPLLNWPGFLYPQEPINL